MLTDPNGVKVMQEERRACDKPGGDFIYYTWNKLSQAVPSPKTSFIKGYPQWQWMVGAGVYLDEVENVVAARRLELQHAVRTRVLSIAGILLGLGVVVALVANLFSRWTRREFAVFSDFFDRAATQSTTIDESSLRFEEFVRLSRCGQCHGGQPESGGRARTASSRSTCSDCARWRLWDCWRAGWPTI